MMTKVMSTPPYVPKKGLRAILDFVQHHGKGDKLSREELHKRGLSAHWTYPALAALRFLGLLDAKDRLTGKHLAFSREEPDFRVQESVLKSAYGDFFRQVALPVKDTGRLKELFQGVYNLSDRVTTSAFPIFQYLAEEAHIPLVVSSSDSLGENNVTYSTGEEVKAPPRTAPGGNEPLQVRHLGYQVTVNLQVTKYTTEKDLMKMIRTANRAIHLMKKSGDKFS